MVVGVIGATISPWQMFYLQGAVVEKEVFIKEFEIF